MAPPEPGSPSSKKRSRDRDEPISPPPMKRTAQSAISKTAVANFFTPTSQKPKSRTAWLERSPSDGNDSPATLLVGTYTPEASGPTLGGKKIAAFDFDSTLVTTASGKRHGKDATDWKWWHSSVPIKLKQLFTEGFHVVVLSNQAGMPLYPDPKSKPPKNLKDRVVAFKKKFESVATQLDIPLTLYAATGKDIYRKPRTGMWDSMLHDKGFTSVDVDLGNSMFVGDAGGRTASGKTPKDFSCSDRNLAANIGVKFFTPEEFFLGEPPRQFTRDFEPTVFSLEGSADEFELAFEKKSEKEVVLFCGAPGAGKSTFYSKNLRPLGHERINQDTLKSKEKCLEAARAALDEGDSVAIDNTNADLDTRAQWIQLAKKERVPIRCVWFKTPIHICEHNDAVRSMNKAMNPESRTGLPKLAFNSFASKFVAPKVDEGFQEVIEVDFKFRGTKEEYDIWARYWL